MSHQSIWDSALPSALVAKFSVMPSQLAAMAASVDASAKAHSLEWKLVAQSVGCGYASLAGNDTALRSALLSLRDDVATLGGTIVALGCPLAVKRGVDVWGPSSDAQPLMVRIKQRFDPEGTLNPGRFVGGI
jgi:glycolate oxidase FAD binding subunit